MGVRLYNPATGRFLSVDPIPGGNANAYIYTTNPINGYDLSGKNQRAPDMDPKHPSKATTKPPKRSSCGLKCRASNIVHHAAHGVSTGLQKAGHVSIHKLKQCGVGVLTAGGTTLGGNVAVNTVRAAGGKYLASFYGGPYGLAAVSAGGCIENAIK
jgi:hypothetical protein